MPSQLSQVMLPQRWQRREPRISIVAPPHIGQFEELAIGGAAIGECGAVVMTVSSIYEIESRVALMRDASTASSPSPDLVLFRRNEP